MTDPQDQTIERGTGLPLALGRITGFMLYWVTNIAGGFYAQVAARLGLESQQIAVLQLLDVTERMVQSRLAEQLHIHKTTMVSLLSGLEARSLVTRHADPADKRALVVMITAAGRAVAHEAEQLNEQADAEFFAALSIAERAELRRLLARVAASHSGQISEKVSK